MKGGQGAAFSIMHCLALFKSSRTCIMLPTISSTDLLASHFDAIMWHWSVLNEWYGSKQQSNHQHHNSPVCSLRMCSDFQAHAFYALKQMMTWLCTSAPSADLLSPHWPSQAHLLAPQTCKIKFMELILLAASNAMHIFDKPVTSLILIGLWWFIFDTQAPPRTLLVSCIVMKSHCDGTSSRKAQKLGWTSKSTANFIDW